MSHRLINVACAQMGPIAKNESREHVVTRLVSLLRDAKARGAELVVYPGEYHSFTKPTHLKDRYERYLAWYAQYLKGESPSAEKAGN